MTATDTNRHRDDVLDVAIIGSGFGGLGMAISLQNAGVTNFAILEKDEGVGGTWRENTYPGAACDVPSHLYSYSFHRYDWSRRYPPQHEILAYIDDVVRSYDLVPHLRFGVEVRAAVYDEASARWTLTLSDDSNVRARAVVSAVGQLNRPALPDVPGTERFAGVAWHSARWNHDHDLRGQRVAVIGTGASAIQFVPEVAKVAGAVTVFQRSAPYVIPKPDRRYRPYERELYARVPALEKLDRATIFGRGELFTSAILGNERARGMVMKLFTEFLHEEIADPELRAQLTPDYVVGCKRVLFSNDWYATFRRDNARLVTEPVAEVTATGVRTADGQAHDADVLIYGTGFHATDFLQPMHVVGRDGVDLHTAWRDGAHAYRGVTVHGFPNLFLLYGPNTNLGGNSIIYMLEAQIGYVQRALEEMARHDLAAIEVRRGVQDDYNDWIDEASRSTAWETGCHSWYTAHGRNTNNWPQFTFRYRRQMRSFDLTDYTPTPRRSTAPRPAAPAGST